MLRHFWNKEGTTTTRNAIQKHHPGRVENIPDHLQLLDEWKNLDARKIHGKVDKELISQADANIELKRKGIQIILDDGTKLGAPDINPEKQMRDYEKFVERKVKQVVKAGELPQLASALNLEKGTPLHTELMKYCPRGKQLAKAGGRIGFSGTCSIDEAATGLKNELSKVKNPAQLGKFGKIGRLAGGFFGWVDAPIELTFALPGLFKRRQR